MKKLSVLMLSPDPDVHGGVVVFIETLKAHVSQCEVTPLSVGSRQDRRESVGALAARLLGMPLKAARLARQRNFDVVHLNPSLTWKATIRDGLILLALRIAGVRRVLVYFHGWNSRFERRIRQTPGLRQCFAWLLNGASQIIVLSPEFKRGLEEMGVYSSKITFGRTMFDGGGLNPGEDVFPNAGRRTILFMSRFVSEKGIYELMDAFARIASDFPDADLVLAGDGPEAKGLKERAVSLGLGGRIVFPGYVGGAEKYRLLQGCTLYALPTYLPGEGMPVALLEAMGAGKPLLTTKAGAIAYIVSDPQNGVVLDAATPCNIEAGLRRLLGHPEYCAEAGKRNAAYAWEHFEAGKVTAEIEALYCRIAGRP